MIKQILLEAHALRDSPDEMLKLKNKMSLSNNTFIRSILDNY